MRRFLAVAAVAGQLAISGSVVALDRSEEFSLSEGVPQTHMLGQATAEHSLIVYMSMICEHCSSWYLNVMPRVVSDYIDTGKAKLIFRNTPTEPVEYSGPAAGITLCAAEGRFFDVVDSLLRGEKAVREGASLAEWQDEAVAASGRTREEMNACLMDADTLAILSADVDAAVADGVMDTPTAIVDGILLREPTFDNIRAVIESVPADTAPTQSEPAAF